MDTLRRIRKKLQIQILYSHMISSNNQHEGHNLKHNYIFLQQQQQVELDKPIQAYRLLYETSTNSA